MECPFSSKQYTPKLSEFILNISDHVYYMLNIGYKQFFFRKIPSLFACMSQSCQFSDFRDVLIRTLYRHRRDAVVCMCSLNQARYGRRILFQKLMYEIVS